MSDQMSIEMGSLTVRFNRMFLSGIPDC
ncbi:hypothetical protein MICRO8M_80449 [Microbacterium sp. 8M]|nr:hypothetical protein MICRO8M_80449 [Microbacterium sp. 8M]